VDFVVVGGATAIAHGFARLTQDLAIVYEGSPANLDRLIAALAYRSERVHVLKNCPPVAPRCILRS
jgi:hypothetical protein